MKVVNVLLLVIDKKGRKLSVFYLTLFFKIVGIFEAIVLFIL